MKTFIALLFLLILPLHARADEPRAMGPEELRMVQEDISKAEDAVRKIVNQPVTRLKRDPTLNVGEFAPGWFLPGALKPEYDEVDVKKTQEFPYAKYEYVTSDINPGEMFVASELEFNKMTKMYYTDRSTPKHRLSDDEMTEINRLYRVIAEGQKKLIGQRVAEMIRRNGGDGFLMSNLGYILFGVFVLCVIGIYSIPEKRHS